MFTYKNKVTGAVVSVCCECSGGDWEPVAPKDQKKSQKKAPEKKPGAGKEQ